MAAALIVSLAAAVLAAAAQSGAGQSTVDTRIYAAKDPAGLSLKLDLKLPAAAGRGDGQPSLTMLSSKLPSGVVAENNAPPSTGTPWPYFVFGLLALGASAVWLRTRRQAVPTAHRRTPAQPAASTPVETAPHDEEADLTADSLPGDQFGTSIELLKSHIEQHPTESHVPWLLLLDLLHRTGNAQEYEEVRRQCKQHFNVDMPQYKKIKIGPRKEGIESYPHIMSKLIRLWPGEEAASYLNALLHDSRDGSRAGFDLATYRDIALLRSILEAAAITRPVQDPSAPQANPFATD